MISYEKQLLVLRMRQLILQINIMNDDFSKNKIVEDVLQLCLLYRIEKDIDMDSYECPEQCRCGRPR